jgi:hypothetical protein
MTRMNVDQQESPLAKVKTSAAAYRRAKAAYERAQAKLAEDVVAALRAGERPADVARTSEWDREHIRRLRKKADEAEQATDDASSDSGNPGDQ